MFQVLWMIALLQVENLESQPLTDLWLSEPNLASCAWKAPGTSAGLVQSPETPTIISDSMQPRRRPQPQNGKASTVTATSACFPTWSTLTLASYTALMVHRGISVGAEAHAALEHMCGDCRSLAQRQGAG
jgi:hypothetical protein